MTRATPLLALALLISPLAAASGEAAAEAKPTAVAKSAQGSIELSRWTLDAGGTTSASAGSLRLAASVGQPDAAFISGGPFRLHAGFWVPEPSGDELFADGFE